MSSNRGPLYILELLGPRMLGVVVAYSPDVTGKTSYLALSRSQVKEGKSDSFGVWTGSF